MADDFTDAELDELEASVQRLGTTIRQCNDRMDAQLDHLESSLSILAQKVVQLSKKIGGSSLLFGTSSTPAFVDGYKEEPGNSKYYSVSLNIGNFPDAYDLDIDTGSDLTWVQCNALCKGCTKPPSQQYKSNKNLVLWGDRLCGGVQSSPSHHCQFPNEQCDYEVEYTDHGSSLGVPVRDYIPLQLTSLGLMHNVVGPCLSSYKINQTQDKIGVFVSVVSTKIPFKGTGKEYSGNDITEIASAVKYAIQQCCVQLKSKIVKKMQAREQQERKRNLSKYVPDVSGAVYSVLKEMAQLHAPKKSRYCDDNVELLKKVSSGLITKGRLSCDDNVELLKKQCGTFNLCSSSNPINIEGWRSLEYHVIPYTRC